MLPSCAICTIALPVSKHRHSLNPTASAFVLRYKILCSIAYIIVYKYAFCMQSDSSSQIGEHSILPYVTRNVVQNTRPSFLHVLEGPGHETRREELACYFLHVSTVKGRKGVKRPKDLNCAWAYPRLRTEKKTKGSGQLTTCI